MGHCTLDSSWINAELTTVCDTDRYENNSSPSTNGLSNGGLARYSLRLWKAASHSSIQWKAYLRVLKKGRLLSVAFETNLFSAATCLVSLWTSLTIFGEVKSSMALTFSGSASIPRWDTMKPRNFPDKNLKTNFARLSFILYLLKVSNVFWGSSRWVLASLLFTSMSST